MAEGRDVFLSAGASIVQQDIAARLLDELQLHQPTVLLGDGVRLWDGIGAAWCSRVGHARRRGD
ncbi:hypothetical protein ACLQ3F_07730 [Micromonospora sp. DT15]|uniref:hypothetical protein n=1 Tax=Micromonospora sp. DT15 TaxID=3393445 RepID=UPI003CE8E14E